MDITIILSLLYCGHQCQFSYVACLTQELTSIIFVSSDSEGECLTNELLNEVSLLKEKNKIMENELKDMEERYSEISLKFAEVEGERQQLVMAVRNLKNGKKN